MISVSPEKQLEEIKKGVDEIIAEDELLKKLQRSYELQKPLVVKFGADPSRPDIHFGHVVVLNKLRLLQNFGHKIKFIIGDFTALIGDPTGKSKLRPQLTEDQVNENAQTYKQQVFKILDPKKTDIVYNSHWLNKFSSMDFIRLLASRTVQQLLARDDFSKRHSEQVPIFLHELVYPVMQAYDSFELKADIELGGTDQKFNLLLGREFQRQMGQESQSIILSPILEGLDGVQKMSKSLDNYISLDDTPNDIFGKTMSISDTLMLRYYELLSQKDVHDLHNLADAISQEKIHPMIAKKDLAFELVSLAWDKKSAADARHYFENVFTKKELPSDIATHIISSEEGKGLNILQLLVEISFCKSKSEARRIIKQNGVKIDQKTLTSESFVFEKNKEYILKQGKLKIIKLISK